MNWARRLKRVFGIEIDTCARCGGRLRIIASIEEPEVIAKILAHGGAAASGGDAARGAGAAGLVHAALSSRRRDDGAAR